MNSRWRENSLAARIGISMFASEEDATSGGFATSQRVANADAVEKLTRVARALLEFVRDCPVGLAGEFSEEEAEAIIKSAEEWKKFPEEWQP